MRRFLPYFGILALLITSCSPRYCDTTFYQRTERQKAIVAVLPVINNVNDQELDWDLSMELTDEIRRKVFDSSRIYLLRDHGGLELAKRLNTPNPKTIPSDEIKKLGAAEFVVVAELLEQNETPCGIKRNPMSKGEVGSKLNLSMRVRVIDVRQDTPKVILQEVIENEHIIASPYTVCDYSRTPWGTEAFLHTPLGIAHNKIVRELVSRVENYVEAVR